MHRNTYVVVAILAVLAALVVGVNIGKKVTPPTPIPTPTQSVTPTLTLETFTDTICGFSVRYTNDFSLTQNASGSAVLAAPTGETNSIVMTCQKDIPRPALPAEQVETLVIPTSAGASVSAKLYHDTSAKDGTPINAVLFTHPTNKLDVFIAGYGPAFDSLVKTIQVLL